MAKIERLVFDWSGTLIDDTEFCWKMVNMLLKRDGKPMLRDVAHYRSLFTFPVEDFYKSVGYMDVNERKDVIAEFVELYNTRAYDGCELHDGVVDTLQLIKDKGLSQCILSTSERTVLTRQVQHFGIGHFFDKIVGSSHNRNDSKANLVQEIAEGTSASSALESGIYMIGDTVHDYEVSQLATPTWDCILIPNGQQSVEALKDTPCQKIKCFRDLSKLL